MCHSETCLIFLFITILISFAVLVFYLLRIRVKLQKNDYLLKGNELVKKLTSVPNQSFIYSLWQDEGYARSKLIIRQQNDTELTNVTFQTGQRSYQFSVGNELFTIEKPWVWSGQTFHLKSANGSILATLVRIKRFPQIFQLSGDHLRPIIFNVNSLHPDSPITLLRDQQQVGKILHLSRLRRVGNIALFDEEITPPVRIFLLTIFS